MLTDTVTDAVLWIIFAALIALIPLGCVMTRPKKETSKKDEATPAA